MRDSMFFGHSDSLLLCLCSIEDDVLGNSSYAHQTTVVGVMEKDRFETIFTHLQSEDKFREK